MVIINGAPSADEKIELDSGYSFGRGVFETILIKSKPIFLTQHLERLNRGLQVVKINANIPEQYVLSLINQYDIYDCALKIIASEKNIVLSTRPVTYKSEDYERGFKVKLSSLKRNPYSRTAYIKSLNFTDNLLEKEQAAAEGYDEVLFCNTNQELAEGSVSNVFAVIGGKILTPSIECGILDGIVRHWVIKHFEVKEDRLPIEALNAASEVFLTNSIMGIMKVKSINGIVFEDSPVCKTVLEKYEECINV